MLIRILLSFGLLILVAACSSESSTSTNDQVEYVQPEITEVDDFNYDTLRGMYIGDFGGSDIRVIVNYISSSNAVGYNIHRGLQRNLNGSVARSGDSVTVLLAEPGDHEFDGVFELLFVGESDTPSGSWNPNDRHLERKTFKLKKIIPDNVYEEDEEITIGNFARFFSDCSDDIGDYHFRSDGLVIFSYYPHSEYSNRNQLQEVQGTWSLEGIRLSISWEKNDVFPEAIMKYDIQKHDYELELFYNDSISIFPNYYP